MKHTFAKQERNQVQAVLIPEEGDIRVVEVSTTRWDEPDSIQNWLRCGAFQVVRGTPFRGHGAVLVVDDAGALIQRPVNLRASLLYAPYALQHGVLYGPALVMGEGLIYDENGFPDVDFLSLTEIEKPDGREWVELVRFMVEP